uniref:T-cell surface glycoprotein CD3 zeta chain n=1 Tax=Sus scrofa TaxID=9823 RepID=A0A4X1VCT2_PIG
MKWTALVIVAILQAQFPITAAQSFGLLDPKLCYLLDGILFIYGVIITALFLREKFSRSADVSAYQSGQNQVYNELNIGRREEYAVLDRRGGLDPEMGGKPQRKKNPHEVVYNVSTGGGAFSLRRLEGRARGGLWMKALLPTPWSLPVLTFISLGQIMPHLLAACSGFL